jgi:hypothetical protein
MDKPDQRLFNADLQSAEFRMGVDKGQWGMPEEGLVPADFKWPQTVLWVAAPARPNAPARFYLILDLAGYRVPSPTGTFWDPETKGALELSKRPKGRPNSRVAMVFRTNWMNGSAFYHPYDRIASQGHAEWPSQEPEHVWTSDHTIVDFLQEIFALLNSEDYVGV